MADDVSAYDKISAARTSEEADAVQVEVERGGFKPFGECTREDLTGAAQVLRDRAELIYDEARFFEEEAEHFEEKKPSAAEVARERAQLEAEKLQLDETARETGQPMSW